MLARVVAYLHAHRVPFHLSSNPSPEPLPAVAGRRSLTSLMVDTRLVLVDARPAIVCVPHGEKLSLARLQSELGASVTEAGSADLPAPFTNAREPIPPLGGAIGALVIVDEALTRAAALAFGAFDPADVLEVPYEELARLERPRIASITAFGELPETAGPGNEVEQATTDKVAAAPAGPRVERKRRRRAA